MDKQQKKSKTVKSQWRYKCGERWKQAVKQEEEEGSEEGEPLCQRGFGINPGDSERGTE